MLDQHGFDLWAEGYDKSVGLSDEDGTYPFAGYKLILNEIYNRVLSHSGRRVLDVGFGTGVLTSKLYEQGCEIYGQDFSEKMIALAKSKMPKAQFVQGDFSLGVASELKERQYDAIVATYSLHHLTDGQKITMMKSLLSLLKEGGHLYIGDVAFETREELLQCRAACGEAWDEEEIYFVAEEIRKVFPAMDFEPFSYCAGILHLEKRSYRRK